MSAGGHDALTSAGAWTTSLRRACRYVGRRESRWAVSMRVRPTASSPAHGMLLLHAFSRLYALNWLGYTVTGCRTCLFSICVSTVVDSEMFVVTLSISREIK